MNRTEVALIFIVLVVMLFGGSYLFFSATGGSFLKVEKESGYITDDPVLSKPVYHLVIAQTGSGRSAVGSFNAQIARELNFSVTPIKDVTFTVDGGSFCNYQLLDEHNLIKKVSIQPRGGSCILSYCSGSYWPGGDKCSDRGGNYVQDLGCSASSGTNFRNGQAYSVSFVSQGVVYEIDPTPMPKANMTFTIRYGDMERKITLSDDNPTDSIGTAIRGMMDGGLMGSIQCPDIGAYASLYVPPNSNEGYLVKKNYYDDVVDTIFSMNDNPQYMFEDASTLDRQVERMKSSETTVSNLCPAQVTEKTLQTASVVCNPIEGQSVKKVLAEFWIAADEIGEVVPVGEFQISNAKTQRAAAANIFNVTVDVKNVGDDASADISVEGEPQVCFVTRETIKSGETKPVTVNCEGAGISGTYKVIAKDVNNPSAKSEAEIQIVVDPICGEIPPSPNHVAVATEKLACVFVCPNQHIEDVFESGCGEIASYDRCENQECTRLRQFTGYHCTDIGKYMDINTYMDAVEQGRKEPFIPEFRVNEVWVQYPYCNYMAAFGYTYENGVPVRTSGQFDYTTQFASKAVMESITTENPVPPAQNETVEIVNVPATQESQEVPSSSQATDFLSNYEGNAESGAGSEPVINRILQDDNAVYVFGAVVAIVVFIVGYTYITRKRR